MIGPPYPHAPRREKYVAASNAKLFVNRTKDEIQKAPEFDPERYQEEAYRNNVGTYYGERMPAGTRR